MISVLKASSEQVLFKKYGNMDAESLTYARTIWYLLSRLFLAIII